MKNFLKKTHINNYVIKILYGESFIKKNKEILKVGNDFNQGKLLCSNTSETDIKGVIDSILATELQNVQTKIRTLEQTLSSQSSSIREIKNKIQILRKNIPVIESNINKIQETLNLFRTLELSNIKLNIYSTNEAISQIYTNSIKNNDEIQKNLIRIVRYLKLPET